MNLSPRNYGLDHDEFRPGQYEAILWALSSPGIKVLSAPTGSGKTAIASAISSRIPAISLVHTKHLQQELYGHAYDWLVLKGKSNYPCEHVNAQDGETTDLCRFAKPGEFGCPNMCEYYRLKSEARYTDKLSLNYAYYFLAQWVKPVTRVKSGSPMKVPGTTQGTLVMDEVHELPEIITNHAGLIVYQKEIDKWDMPPIPRPDPMTIMETGKLEVARKWMSKAFVHMKRIVDEQEYLAQSEDNPDHMKIANAATRVAGRIESTLVATEVPEHWWVSFHDEKLVCKPLTARYHFHRYFDGFPTTVLMSATIGNVEAFTEELGIKEFDYHNVLNQWPAETRPVRIFRECPNMSWKNMQKYGNSIFEKQADVVAKAILDCPPDWNGVLHVTRKTEATLVAERLSRRGLADRVWVPPIKDGLRFLGTEEQMDAWHEAKARTPGIIAIAWNWYQGVDLQDSQICGVLKIPYPSTAEPFEKARLKFSPKTYRWRTGNRLEQSLGRTRRGEPEDYDLNGKKNQLVFIADMGVQKIKNMLSDDMQEALVYE